MKRARSPSPESRARKYPATSLPPDMRTAFAVAYLAVEELGVEKREYLSKLCDRGYVIDARTFDRWLARLRGEGSAVSSSKGSGRPPSLTDEQLRRLVGFVLAENARNNEVHLADAVAFLKRSFDLDVVERTALTYLNANGFACHVTQTKSSGYQLSESTLAEIGCSWIRSMRKSKFFDVADDMLCSVDFTFTSHRTDRRTTISPVGSPQPKNSMQISKYTNCIVTGIWRDGKHWTPCMVFTKNPKFNLHRNSTKKRDAEDEYLRKKLKQYKIDYDRIQYVGGKGDTGTYVSESSELIQAFFEQYDFIENCHILSDNGSSFSGDLTDLGFARHERFPAPVHQFLSPNDNRLHGVAKAQWRAEIKDFSDDVDATLSLMNKLDWVSTKHIREWFDRNLMLQERNITTEGMMAVFGKNAKKKSQWHAECLHEFRVWNCEDARGGVPAAPRGLESRLDGARWQR